MMMVSGGRASWADGAAVESAATAPAVGTVGGTACPPAAGGRPGVTADVSAVTPAPPLAGFFRKKVGASAISIMSATAQMTRRSMDSGHRFRVQDRRHRDERGDIVPGAAPRAT